MAQTGSTKLVSRFPGALFLVLVIGLSVGGAGNALPMGPRQIADFEREALGVLRILLGHPMEEQGDRAVVTLRNEPVKGLRVRFGQVTFAGLTPDLRSALTAGQVDFEEVRKLASIQVRAELGSAELQAFIDQEIARVRSGRRIFESVSTRFESGRVQVSGLMHLEKIPGNPLAFLAQNASPFTATVQLGLQGSQITIDVLEAQVNQQPMTPELHTQVMAWLNPLWDLGQMPYPAHLETLEISPAGITAAGWLFAP